MSMLLPGSRVFVLDDDCDDHIEIRVTPGIVRKVIVETEADADGGVCHLASYEIEPEGAPSVRMRRLFSDVIHAPEGIVTPYDLGRAILRRIQRMRPACSKCGEAMVGRHECDVLDIDDTQRGRNAYHAGSPRVRKGRAA